jgi:hypothetical protein
MNLTSLASCTSNAQSGRLAMKLLTANERCVNSILGGEYDLEHPTRTTLNLIHQCQSHNTEGDGSN